MPRPRPRVTPSDALLLFVTEPQQLDAVFEVGTETLSPTSIRVPVDEDDAHDDDCDCAVCENERALDDDADAYLDREV